MLAHGRKSTEDNNLKDGRYIPAWIDIAELPFLDACVSEALRLQPPFTLPLERVVPPEGLSIGGRYIPAGTLVGMSPWVVNRHRPTFGEDADEWRPERWLVTAEKRRAMEQSVLTVRPGPSSLYCHQCYLHKCH